jgi:GH15 family glucan-1,4-alpha-glucosidase
MQQTYQRIHEKLSAGPGLIYRYEQSSDAREGAFAMCCFWLSDFLARGGGSSEEAHHLFAQTLSYANDLGLFAEEIDPQSGGALGNFPQAFTHVGLINAALSIAQRDESEGIRADELTTPDHEPASPEAPQ